MHNNQESSKEKKDRLELAGRRIIEVLDDMATIFLPKDKLLSSAGIFPVYYWLIRDLGEQQFPKLRELLVRIEEERKTTLQLLAKDPQNKHIDKEIVQFNSYYRSPNDAASLEGRFRILRSRFLEKTLSK